MRTKCSKYCHFYQKAFTTHLQCQYQGSHPSPISTYFYFFKTYSQTCDHFLLFVKNRHSYSKQLKFYLITHMSSWESRALFKGPTVAAWRCWGLNLELSKQNLKLLHYPCPLLCSFAKRSRPVDFLIISNHLNQGTERIAISLIQTMSILQITLILFDWLVEHFLK